MLDRIIGIGNALDDRKGWISLCTFMQGTNGIGNALDESLQIR
jgi:hypothetical protein